MRNALPSPFYFTPAECTHLAMVSRATIARVESHAEAETIKGTTSRGMVYQPLRDVYITRGIRRVFQGHTKGTRLSATFVNKYERYLRQVEGCFRDGKILSKISTL